jgi:hypothetical protein
MTTTVIRYDYQRQLLYICMPRYAVIQSKALYKKLNDVYDLKITTLQVNSSMIICKVIHSAERDQIKNYDKFEVNGCAFELRLN